MKHIFNIREVTVAVCSMCRKEVTEVCKDCRRSICAPCHNFEKILKDSIKAEKPK